MIAEIGLNHGGSRRAGARAGRCRGRGRRRTPSSCRRSSPASSSRRPVRRRRTCRPRRSSSSSRQFELDEAAHRAVAERARARTASRVLSTPFSLDAVDMLERVGVDAYKIASGDLTWDQLIARVRGDRQAARHLDRHGDARRSAARASAVARRPARTEIALLHCVSRLSGARAAARTCCAIRDARRALRRAGRPVRSRRRHVRAADGRRARRLALRAAPRARRRRRRRSIAPSRARPASWRPRFGAAGAPGRRSGRGRKVCLAAEAVERRAPAGGRCAPRAPCRPARARAAAISIALRPATGLPPASLPRSWSAAGWPAPSSPASRRRRSRCAATAADAGLPETDRVA